MKGSDHVDELDDDDGDCVHEDDANGLDCSLGHGDCAHDHENGLGHDRDGDHGRGLEDGRKHGGGVRGCAWRNGGRRCYVGVKGVGE